MALGYAALANLGVRHLSEPYREEVMRETGGAVAVGGRDRHSMIYFGQSRNGLAPACSSMSVRGTDRDHRDGLGPISGRCPGRTSSLLRESRPLRQPLVPDAGRHRACRGDGGRRGFTISAGEWQDDVAAVGVR